MVCGEEDKIPESGKANGFSHPLPACQVATWIVFAYLNISFHAIFGCHEDAMFILFNAVHICLSIIVFSFGYATTKSNVVEPLLKERGFPNAQMSLETFHEKHFDLLKSDELCWCKYCEWYVNKSSKHCRACNRCTNEFDHHCRWLNNCIAADNYTQFFITICSTETILIYEIVLGTAMLMKQIDMTQHIFIGNWQYDTTFIHALIAFHVAVASSIAFPLIQLIFFHIYLYFKQMTTYEWVVERALAQHEKECNLAQNKYVKAEKKEKQQKAEANDVKLSGLSSIISTKSSLNDEESVGCCMRKRNSIHVAFGSMFGSPIKNETAVRMNKYSHEQDTDNEERDADDKLFGPGQIQSIHQQNDDETTTTDTDHDEPYIIDSDFEHQYL